MRWGEVFPAPAMSHNIDLWLLYANTAQQAASGNYKKKQKKTLKLTIVEIEMKNDSAISCLKCLQKHI